MAQRKFNRARYAEKLIRQAYIWEDDANRLASMGESRLAGGVRAISKQFGDMGRALRD